MDKVWIVLTEVNGYRNIYGHYVFLNESDALDASLEAAQSGRYDEVYVTWWAVR